MGRPKKNKVEYFPHFVKWGKTLTILEDRYGNNGVAFWWKLLELLGDTDGHVYDTRAEEQWLYLVSRMKIEDDQCRKTLGLLATLNAIDAALWEHGLIWSQNFVDGLAKVYEKRRSDPPPRPTVSGPETLNKSDFPGIPGPVTRAGEAYPGIPAPETPQRKVEESTEQEKTSTVKRGKATDIQELTEEDFVLRLHDGEFQNLLVEIKRAVSREHGFQWPETTGGLESDLRQLVYASRRLGLTDKKKRSILYDAYKVNNEKMNWATYILRCVEIVLMKSRKSAIRQPFKFIISEYLKNPQAVITEYTEGVAAKSKPIFSTLHSGG